MSEIEQEMNADSAVDQQTPPTLTLNDIISVTNMIDVAVQRGAFKTAEIKAVGEVYEKLVTFVQYISNQQKKETE
jgi:hypothetical protein